MILLKNPYKEIEHYFRVYFSKNRNDAYVSQSFAYKKIKTILCKPLLSHYSCSKIFEEHVTNKVCNDWYVFVDGMDYFFTDAW